MITKTFIEEVMEVFNQQHPELKVVEYGVQKNNTKEKALLVSQSNSSEEASTVCPLIYASYLERFDNTQKAVDYIWHLYNEEMSKSVSNIVISQNYEEAKGRLFVRVVGRKNNEEYLRNAIKKDLLDVSLVLSYLAVDDGDNIGSTIVRSGLIKDLPDDRERLFQDAFDNTEKLFPTYIESLGGAIFNLCSLDQETMEMMENLGKPPYMTMPRQPIANAEAVIQDMTSSDMLFIISNNRGVNGAAQMFNKKTLDILYAAIKKPFAILPSSIHECLICIQDKYDLSVLLDMVTEVNLTQVAPEERLTDNVYYYDGKELTSIE